MKLNFYSKLAVLLCTMVSHCFAATEQERVNAGLAFIGNHDDARCGKYNATPSEVSQYQEHTNAIDALLSDETRVSRAVEASDAAIRAIVTAAIDDKITHRSDQSRHGRSSPVKEKFHSLDANNALYNYFHVLSLIEDVAESFVTGHATRHFFERRDQQPYPTVLPG